MAKDTPSFVLELKLDTTPQDDKVLAKRFFLSNKVKNVLISYAKTQLNILKRMSAYHEALADYHLLKERLAKAKKDKDPDLIEDLTLQFNEVKFELDEIIKALGLTQNDFQKYLKVQQKKYSKYLDSQIVQEIADEVYSGVSEILYGDGRKLHYKKALDTLTISGKSNTQGIRYRCDDKGRRIEWLGLTLSVKVKKGDSYALEVLNHKVKFCRITRKMLGSRWHYYVQLVLEGIPPIKHRPGEGKVGIDNGPSVFSVISDSKVSFEVLGTETEDLEQRIVKVQQAIDRSIRVNNPNNYNLDGTVKKGRKRWVYSRRCRVLRRRLRGLYRKKAARLKKATEETANRILAQGDEFITEPIRLKAMQKRAKKTTINKKTGRPNSKKRFGKSISRHAPGAVIAALERKAGYIGLTVKKVDLSTYRASQYNHIDNTYTKKTLDQRWVKIGNKWYQRDLYSGFLLKCPCETLDQIDRTECIAQFAVFKAMHDAYIKELMTSDIQLPSCCGIHNKKAAA